MTQDDANTYTVECTVQTRSPTAMDALHDFLKECQHEKESIHVEIRNISNGERLVALGDLQCLLTQAPKNEMAKGVLGYQLERRADGELVHGEPDDPFDLATHAVLTGDTVVQATEAIADSQGALRLRPVYHGDIEQPTFPGALLDENEAPEPYKAPKNMSPQNHDTQSRRDKVPMATITHTIDDTRAAEMRRILRANKQIENNKIDAVLMIETIKVGDGHEIDVKLCNGESPWVDVVLFDSQGNELQVLEPNDTIFDNFTFSDHNITVTVCSKSGIENIAATNILAGVDSQELERELHLRGYAVTKLGPDDEEVKELVDTDEHRSWFVERAQEAVENAMNDAAVNAVRTHAEEDGVLQPDANDTTPSM